MIKNLWAHLSAPVFPVARPEDHPQGLILGGAGNSPVIKRFILLL
ncbi:hypothetical protein [Chitinophaga sp. 22620]